MLHAYILDLLRICFVFYHQIKQLRAILRERLLVAIANSQGYGLDAIATTAQTAAQLQPVSPPHSTAAKTATTGEPFYYTKYDSRLLA
jgi:hypothetical protein